MAEIKKISTELQLLDKFLDTSGDAGTSGQVLTSTGTGINWVSGGSLPGGPYLPLSAGSSYPLTGHLYIDSIIRNNSGDLEIRNQTASGFATATKLMQETANGLETFLTLDGTSRNAYFTNQGNVGIGTTSPAAKLEVDSSTTPQILVKNTAGAGAKILFEDDDGVTQNASITFSQEHQNTLTIATGYQSPSNTNRINIAPAGHVVLTAVGGSGGTSATKIGIGTTSPTFKLQIDNRAAATTATQSPQLFLTGGSNIGTDYRDGQVIFGSELNTSGSLGWSNASAGVFLDNRWNNNIGFIAFRTKTSGTPVEVMRLTGPGNVGIGTTSPGSLLHLSSSTGPRITLTDTDASIGVDSIIADISFVGTEIGGETARIGAVSETSGGEAGLRFYTGQSVLERLRIDKDGNVGIGTTSPNAKLEVTGSYGDVIKVVSGSQNITTNFVAPSTGSGLNNIISTGGEFNIGTSDAQPFDLVTNSISRIAVLSGGNVGIGTTSPNEKLHVAGNIHAYAPSGIDAGLFASTAAGSTTIAVRSSGVTHFNGGNVGIGTTSPDTLLNLASSERGSNAPTVRITNTFTADDWSGDTSDLGRFEFFTEDTSGNGPYTLGKISIKNDQTVGTPTLPSGAMVFATTTYNAPGGPTERMRITSSGRVGIGTSLPATTLQVNGLISADQGAGNGYTFVGDLDTSIERPAQNTIILKTAGSERLRVNSSGNVGINVTNPNARLNVNGGIKIEGTGSLSFGGSASVPAWAINSSGSDLIIDDQATTSGSVLFNNNEGVALPRLTTTQINAISSPTQGLMAYNTTLNTICFFNGWSWQKVSHANM